jgi:two-component system nitrate/nitrite response regulator NarL
MSGLTPQVRVLNADAQPLYRDAVVRTIRQDARFELVAEADDGRVALEAISRFAPDIAILDLAMPSLDGMRVLNAVVRERLPTRVIILAAALAADAVYQLLAAGAAGCLTKQARAEHVREAVTTVARGGTFIGVDVQTSLARAIRLRAPQDGPVLTDREREVLRRVAEGASVPAIARALQLSPATVKTHLAHVYEKLDVGERAAAVATAMRCGLLE